MIHRNLICLFGAGIGLLLPCVLAGNLTVVEESAADTIPDLDADGNQELAIPLADVLSNNVSQYSGNALYSKYENWTKANDDAIALLNDPSLAANVTFLTSVNCYSNSPDCYFTFTTPGIPDLSVADDVNDDLAVVDERALVEPRKKNAQANHRNVWLHMKTHHKGHAHEHHFHYNLKVSVFHRRLNYPSYSDIYLIVRNHAVSKYRLVGSKLGPESTW